MQQLADRDYYHYSDYTDHSEKKRSQKWILVIDDNEDNVMLNRIVLELAGYKVSTASSGKEALALISESDPVDLILLDMQLGDISGIEFLNILEKQNHEIYESVPVVFLTGMDEIPKSSAKGFLRKPVENATLLDTIQGLLES